MHCEVQMHDIQVCHHVSHSSANQALSYACQSVYRFDSFHSQIKSQQVSSQREASPGTIDIRHSTHFKYMRQVTETAAR